MSELSLGGLVKHVARTERSWIAVILAGRPDPYPNRGDDWGADFRMAAGETVTGLLKQYEEVAAETEEIVNGLPSLEVCVPLPTAPWYPPDSTRSARWILTHVIEETARHAGHADIIREALDGATAFELVAAAQRG